MANGWLNYHHLFYFWTVVREGGVSPASRKLRLAQPTVSGQLKALEEMLGVQLFLRQRGRLVLTDVGAHVYRYADEIFALGRELQDSLVGLPALRGPRLVVGVTDVVPKLIARRLLEPALALPELRIVCYEDRQERLLADLAVHALDLVLSDAPVAAGSNVRAFSHLLGGSDVTLFAPHELARELRDDFPRSLDGAPLLVPTEAANLRRSTMEWLETHGLRMRIRGEFQDSALLGAFGEAGAGVFPAPSVIEDEMRAQYHVDVVGRLDGARESFYAITVERRVQHPAVAAIMDAGRSFFAEEAAS